jgi:hypothetical protein
MVVGVGGSRRRTEADDRTQERKQGRTSTHGTYEL